MLGVDKIVQIFQSVHEVAGRWTGVSALLKMCVSRADELIEEQL
jgi:hypothetical protein